MFCCLLSSFSRFQNVTLEAFGSYLRTPPLILICMQNLHQFVALHSLYKYQWHVRLMIPLTLKVSHRLLERQPLFFGSFFLKSKNFIWKSIKLAFNMTHNMFSKVCSKHSKSNRCTSIRKNNQTHTLDIWTVKLRLFRTNNHTDSIVCVFLFEQRRCSLAKHLVLFFFLILHCEQIYLCFDKA